MLKKLICDQNSTLRDVWTKINLNSKGIIFLVDSNSGLVGVLTDGDIRRILLNGGELSNIASDHITSNYVFGKVTESKMDLLSKTNDKIKIIPIVDTNNKVVDFFEFEANIHIPVAHPDLIGNEFKYLVDAFMSSWISSRGEYISKFESRFSNFCNCQFGVAVSNGTVALHLALETLGVGSGDEVIIPDLTFGATANAVLHASATPVIVDIEENSWCIDPFEIEKAISPRTKAIIPVHLYGQPCNMDKIMSIATKHDLFVVEDCAEAHGASFNGKRVGSFGDIGCFSFFANKIITTGEGGMCVTNNDKYFQKMRLLRDHGMSTKRKYWHDEVGYNYRLTNLQAAIGVAQLERIEEILKNRIKVEELYRQQLSDISFIQFQPKNIYANEKVTWLVSVLVGEKKDQIINDLAKDGIDVRPFFNSLGEMEVFSQYKFSNKTSVMISNCGINLPTTNSINKSFIKMLRNKLLSYEV